MTNDDEKRRRDETRRLADLERLLPLWPREIGDRSVGGRERLVATLARALRAERRRAHGNHWAYDLSRHAALVRIFAIERDELMALTRERAAIPSSRTSQLLIAARAKTHFLGKL